MKFGPSTALSTTAVGSSMQHASRCLTAQGLGTVHHHDDLARSSCRIFHHFKVGAFHEVKAYIPSAWMLLRSLDFFGQIHITMNETVDPIFWTIDYNGSGSGVVAQCHATSFTATMRAAA